MLDQGENRENPVAGDGLRLQFAQAEFDTQRFELRVQGRPVRLERKPLEVLLYLLQHAGEVVTKEELLETVWPGRMVVEAAVSTAIAKLRQALGDADLIKTVHGYGYRLATAVTRQSMAPQAPPQFRLVPGDPVPGRPNWRIARQLGAGAYAEVWLAEHGKTRERRVFKFCGDGLQLAALKREVTLYRLLRDALGERPDFVRLRDWNFETPPYFLECDYGGDDLPAWAEKQGGLGQVPLAQRLELAASVADAVAAAHSAGVLHKDLKPSNILVSADEQGAWQVRLTDFGAGSVLDLQRLDALGITRLGFTQTRALDSTTGTPLYLAPEVLAGQVPTAQADLYALGVLLYQLAVGDFRRPLAPGWEAEIEDELLRQDIGQAADGSPARRLTSAQELAQRLRRLEARHADLRAERATAQRVAATERELERAQARRPWLVSALVALTTGMGLSLYFYAGARAARDDARRQLTTVEQINRFLNEDLLAAVDPMVGRADVSLQQATVQAAAQLERRFGQQPLIEAALRNTLGDAFWSLGDFATAELHHRRQLELYGQTRGADAAQTLAARLDLADALMGQGRLKEAEPLVEAVRAALQRRDERAGPLALQAQVTAARLWHEQGQWERATTELERLMPALLEHDGGASKMAFLARQVLFTGYLRLGRYAELERAARSAIGDLEAAHGAQHPRTAYARYELALAIAGQGRHDEAIPMYQASRKEFETLLGPNHNLVASAINAIATAHNFRGRYAQAEPLFKEVYTRRRSIFGDSHQLTLTALSNWGAMLEELGRDEEALRVHGNGFRNAQKALGEQHPVTQYFAYNLTEAAIDVGRPAEAAPAVAAMARHGETTFPADHEMHAFIPYVLGRYDLARGDAASALARLEQGVTRLVALREPPPELPFARKLLEQARRKLGKE